MLPPEPMLSSDEVYRTEISRTRGEPNGSGLSGHTVATTGSMTRSSRL